MAAQSKTHRMRNARAARKRWPAMGRAALASLSTLSQELPLSVAAGELMYLQTGWYVTHSGLLKLARQAGCAGIDVVALDKFCDSGQSRWIFKATVYKSSTCRGFVGYGDADPSNISPRVRGAEMRVAETRAVNRALRKAYGIGICSVEELGTFSSPLPPAAGQKQPHRAEAADGNRYHPLHD